MFACGASLLVFARVGVHVWSCVGVEVWRWSLLSTAAAARILQMLLRTWCISWSVVRRGYFRGGLRSTRRRILWTAWWQLREFCVLEGVLPCVGACLDLCVGGGDGPDPTPGSCAWPAPPDPLGQAGHGRT